MRRAAPSQGMDADGGLLVQGSTGGFTADLSILLPAAPVSSAWFVL